MKRSYLVMALVIFSCAVNAQFTSSSANTYLVNKPVGQFHVAPVYADNAGPNYKTQKVVGWVLTGVGLGIFTGAVMHDLNNLFSTDQTSTVWYIVSGTLVGTGLSLVIAGGKNKRRAMRATGFIDLENATVARGEIFERSFFPAAGFRLQMK